MSDEDDLTETGISRPTLDILVTELTKKWNYSYVRVLHTLRYTVHVKKMYILKYIDVKCHKQFPFTSMLGEEGGQEVKESASPKGSRSWWKFEKGARFCKMVPIIKASPPNGF